MSIANNLKELKKELKEGVKLIAVSKTKPVEDINEAYLAGHRVFGENKALELRDKQEYFSKMYEDIEWHFIGHLQTNKVKYIAPFVDLIHAVDSEKLLKEIQKRAAQNSRSIAVLLQVHVAEEESKFGVPLDELESWIKSVEWDRYPNVEVAGLMTMATNTSNQKQIETEFEKVKSLSDHLVKSDLLKENPVLSMGMSGDYPIAINCGANMIRVGSKIFGNRNYDL